MGDTSAQGWSNWQRQQGKTLRCNCSECTNVNFEFCLHSNQILHLKKELENRATAHANMESVYTVKVRGLENQLEKQSEKIVDLEKHLKFVRKREAALNAEMTKLRGQSLLEKQNYNESLNELQKTNKALENKCRKIEHELSGALTNLQRQYKDLEKVSPTRVCVFIGSSMLETSAKSFSFSSIEPWISGWKVWRAPRV